MEELMDSRLKLHLIQFSDDCAIHEADQIAPRDWIAWNQLVVLSRLVHHRSIAKTPDSFLILPKRKTILWSYQDFWEIHHLSDFFTASERLLTTPVGSNFR